ncbi:MAG: HAMP domain-containing sensor histidine kinase [Pseudomonadota bacterium]
MRDASTPKENDIVEQHTLTGSRPSISDRTDGGLIARYRRRLSFKLFVLTVICVLIAEAVVLVPSIANQRVTYFKDRIEAAHIVGMALNSQGGMEISAQELEELFATAGIKGVVLVHTDGARELVKAPSLEGSGTSIKYFVDLKNGLPTDLFTAPWMTLFSKKDDLIQVSGKARYSNNEMVDVVLSRAAMRKDLVAYAINIFFLSLAISTLTALFVFSQLNKAIITPVKSLSKAMMKFERSPEDQKSVFQPSSREDEIGDAQRSLFNLQRRIQSLLEEQRRLAALGSGISKISHDLRNILASAQLMSDRLAKSDDPRVAKLAPRLIGSLDRAVALSRDTLNFARITPETLKRSDVDLNTLVTDVFEDVANMDVDLQNETQLGLTVYADANQLYRVIFNIVKNAIEAMVPTNQGDASNAENGISEKVKDTPSQPRPCVTVSSSISGKALDIRIADNGPGLPETAINYLYEPFKGSQKPGGTGLGIAIAREIIKVHGGSLRLVKSDELGATFCIKLPLVASPSAQGSTFNYGATSNEINTIGH